MTHYLKTLAALLVTAIVGSLATFNLTQHEQVEQNVTFIHKTNPHWPVKGAISVEPCRYRHCTNV
jgi:hypothetical protein